MTKKIVVINTGEEYAPYYALVDDEDFDVLNKYIWRAMIGRNTVYAATGHDKLMHRLLVPDAILVDHKNRIGLDNRKENLRGTTHSLNLANAEKRPNCASKYKGVSFVKRRAVKGLVGMK
jgi:hypothetical protein